MTDMENGRATIRDVYQLLGEVREEMDRRFNHVEDKIEVRFMSHEQQHKSIRDEAISRFRWMVGCALGAMTILATVIGFVYR
jgi:hypothetical protein